MEPEWGTQTMTTPPRRRILPHRRPGRSPVLEARHLLDVIGEALGMAIVIRDVDGLGPVRIRATLILGRTSTSETVEGPTEAAALRALARRACLVSGRDEQWLMRYGLGMG